MQLLLIPYMYAFPRDFLLSRGACQRLQAKLPDVSCPFPAGRNAGKEAKDRISSTVMEKIPFLQGCEEEDSDEEEDLESLPLETQRQHKKQRVKVSYFLPDGGNGVEAGG